MTIRKHRSTFPLLNAYTLPHCIQLYSQLREQRGRSVPLLSLLSPRLSAPPLVNGVDWLESLGRTLLNLDLPPAPSFDSLPLNTGKVTVFVASSPEESVGQFLELSSALKLLPDAGHVFFCDLDTAMDDLSLFLRRAFTDPTYEPYFVMDTQLLSFKLQADCADLISRLTANLSCMAHVALFAVGTEENHGHIVSTFRDCQLPRHHYESEQEVVEVRRGMIMRMLDSLHVKVYGYESRRPGYGKTYWINKKHSPTHKISLNGSLTPTSFIRVFSQLNDVGVPRVIHVNVSVACDTATCLYLFRLICLGTVADASGNCVTLNAGDTFILEKPNSMDAEEFNRKFFFFRFIEMEEVRPGLDYASTITSLFVLD